MACPKTAQRLGGGIKLEIAGLRARAETFVAFPAA
jgi:hypothetical protein